VKKPKEPKKMSPRGFVDLLISAIEERNYTAAEMMGHGLNKTVAREAQVSPTRIGEILRGEFPGQTTRREGESAVSHRKRIQGAVHSMTRICDTFGLQLDVCLKACGLPILPGAISTSRRTRKALFLDEDGLRMLLQQVELIGPIPIDLAAQLVQQSRLKKMATKAERK
jgi:hypothetical protein